MRNGSDENLTPYITEIKSREMANRIYCQISIISCNEIVGHSGVVGALPVGAAPTTFVHLHSRLNTCLLWTGERKLRDEKP